MSPQLKVLSRILKYMWRPDHTEALDGGRHRYRAGHLGSGTFRSFDNLPGPKVKDSMVKSLENNAYFLSSCRQADNPPRGA